MRSRARETESVNLFVCVCVSKKSVIPLIVRREQEGARGRVREPHSQSYRALSLLLSPPSAEYSLFCRSLLQKRPIIYHTLPLLLSPPSYVCQNRCFMQNCAKACLRKYWALMQNYRLESPRIVLRP